MPRGRRLSVMAWTRLGARNANEPHNNRSDGALLALRKIRDVENPSCDELIEQGSGLGDVCKNLDLGVRPRCSGFGMTTLDRRDEFAAGTRGRLAPGGDDGCFPNDLGSASCERDLDRIVTDSGTFDDSLDQSPAFARECRRGGRRNRHWTWRRRRC
jgi:hypothetical protein